MTTDISEIYRNDLRFLLRLKEAVGILNNRIHDNLARIAIEHFNQKHAGINFTYKNAGASGIDIRGVDNNQRLRIVAEVKTTLPDANGRIRGPQTNNIKKDLERLRDQEGVDARYLVLLSSSTKMAVQRQLKTQIDFPMVEIFNALEENLIATETDEE